MNIETRNFKKTAKWIIRLNILLVCLLLLLTGVCYMCPAIAASADNAFKYKDYTTGKTVTYTGTVPVYVVDGIEADLEKQPV